MLAIYRLGSHLPAPAVNPNAFSGGGLARLSLFALGIMPYITASIILQVMTPVFPSLQALQKEGELGQRKITQYTRYLTVVLAVVTSVVYVQEGIRKIPIQYAKRMVGRRMTSGGSTYLPLRVNMAGVIPVIFASAIMILPATVASLLPGTLGPRVAQWFQFTSWPYIIGESLLIFAFTFFYVAVVFNSLEQADNLKKYGGFIPGIRPGRPTAQYLESVLVRLTVAGSLFLATVAAAPTLFIKFGGFSTATARALGGTSVLIVVGVAIDTMRQIESQLSMRSYKGFLK